MARDVLRIRANSLRGLYDKPHIAVVGAEADAAPSQARRSSAGR
jgi:hypothetical protein